MTRTNSTQYEFYLTKTQWFEIFGSSLTLDSLILFLATPVSLAGIILNSISFYILTNKKFKSKIIYSYLKVYSLNSMLICLILSTHFNLTYNYFDATNSFVSRAYSSIVFKPIVTILAFFSEFLDILISLERLLDFYPHIKKPTSLKSCFILMFFVLVLSLPYFFIHYPAFLDVDLSENESFRLYYVGFSEFGQSWIGEVVNHVLFFVKDVVLFIAEIVLNIIQVVLFRKNLNRKKQAIKRDSIPVEAPATAQSPPQSPTQLQPPSSPFSGSGRSSFKLSFRSNKSYSFRKFASIRNKNKTIMVGAICVVSGFVHITTIMCNSSLAIAQNSLSFSLCFSSNFFLTFKSFSNFFIFSLFNHLFFSEIKRLVGIRPPSYV